MSPGTAAFPRLRAMNCCWNRSRKMRHYSQQNVETPFGKATAFVGGYCVDFS